MGGSCSKQVSESKIVRDTGTSFILDNGETIEYGVPPGGKGMPQPGVVNYKGYAWTLGTNACETDSLSLRISLSSASFLVVCSSVLAVVQPVAGMPLLCSLSVVVMLLYLQFNARATIDTSPAIFALTSAFLWPSRGLASLVHDEPTERTYRQE